jgi:hypothetical protein
MSSYSAGTHYGYDEINVNSSDFTGTGSHFDSNGIKSIKSREKRLQQKLNMNKYNDMYDDPYADLKVNHYTAAGIDRTKIRRQIIRKPEDYFVMGQNDYNNKAHTLESFRNPVEKPIKTTKKNKMQEDLEELERINNMLTIFIFFLVIMIIIQYSKMYNDPKTISVMILDPRATEPDQLTTPATVIA